jgi:hypothetical protein
MNRDTVCVTFVATIAATLALVSATAMAAKPGGGGSTDPCANSGLDFPAFAYWMPSGKTMEILVADATGKCIRSVIRSSGTGATIQFSYPVVGADGVTRGRVVWVDAPAVVAVDFTVATGTNQISVGPKKTLYTGTGGGISLSKDGHTLYSSRFLNTGEIFIDKLALDTVGAVAVPVLQTATTNEYIGTISVSGDETVLYADYKPSAGASPLYQLVYVLLPGGSITATSVLDSNNSSRELNPAVDPWSSSYRVAYQRVAATAGGCDLLVTSSSLNPFATILPLQPAYGMKPTWLNGKILADGRVASTRNGCDYTGTIMQTDPATGVQTALTSGYDPDGK